MGIRTKTILSIVVAVVLSVGLFYHVADRVIENRFTTLEAQQARSRMSFTLRLLESGRDGLDLLVRDWSLWNDAHTFLENRNPAFIESNLVATTFSDTGLSYIGFFPLHGKAVWEGFYDHTAKKRTPIPHEFTQTLAPLVSHLRKRGAGSQKTPGFFVSAGTLHFIAVSPILKSDGSGPSQGWLIMVQQIEKNYFDGLFPLTDTKVMVTTRPIPTATTTVDFHFTDKRHRYACTGPLTDIWGNTTIEVTLHGPSEIFLAGERLLSLTGAGITFTGLLLALLTYLLIQRTLLKRILLLRQQVAPAAIPGSTVINVHPNGNDELSELAVDINRVFARILEEECLNRSILRALHVGVLLIDAPSGCIRDANICMETLVGKKREELVGISADTLFHPLSMEDQSPLEPHQEKGTLEGTSQRHVIRTKTATRYHDTAIRIDTYTDIEAIETAAREAEHSAAHYRTLFKNSATPSVLFCKNGNIAKFNREFMRYAGAKEDDELLGRHWTHFINHGDEAKLRRYLEEKKSTNLSFDDNMEVTFHDLLGGVHTAMVHVARLPGTENRIVSMLDMTRQKKAEEMLRHQAFYDSLTGLANRRLFMETLDHAMDVARRRKLGLTLLLIDLDGFKHVNDTLGHLSGDRLLTLVAERLTTTLRKSDAIARLGGDEFTLLVEECYSTQELVLLLQRIQEAFKAPFAIGSTHLHVTLSIGVARFPDDAKDSETLIRNADLAMYRAKKTGNAYNFFTHRLDKEAKTRFEMEQDLRRAMDESQFSLYLQPRIGLEGNLLMGMEGLIRWCHPTKGLCSPAEFIPCAEMNGLIVPMDLWVLETGCRLIAEWNRERPTPLLISLNISAWHFRSNHLPEKVAGVLEKTGCKPQWLELEVTETALVDNLSAATPHLKRLRDMGVSIALDDFGTGYSSLNYLRTMPVDTLKIDRSFITTLREEDEKGMFLVKTIVELGKTFGIQVVAEGVEEPEQMRLLKSIGCPVAQGYLWSPPVPPEEFPHHLTVYPPEK